MSLPCGNDVKDASNFPTEELRAHGIRLQIAWCTDQSPEPSVHGAGPAASVAARLRAKGWAPEDRERGLNGRASTSAEPLETSQTSNTSHLEHLGT